MATIRKRGPVQRRRDLLSTQNINFFRKVFGEKFD